MSGAETAATWYAITDADGALVSTGTVIDRDALTETGLTVIELPGPPPYVAGSSYPADYVWNEGDRGYVAPAS